MPMDAGDSTGKSSSYLASRIDKENNLEHLLHPYLGHSPKRLSFALAHDECDGNGNSSGSGSGGGGGGGTDLLAHAAHGKPSSQANPRSLDATLDTSLADSMVSYMSELSRTRRRRRREQLALNANGDAEMQRLQLERALKSLEEMQRENKERMRHSVSMCVSPCERASQQFSRTKSATGPGPRAPPRRQSLERAHTLLAMPSRSAVLSPRLVPPPPARQLSRGVQSPESFTTPRGARNASRRSASPPIIILTVDSRRNMGEEDARRLLSIEGGRAGTQARMQQAALLGLGSSPQSSALPSPPPHMPQPTPQKQVRQFMQRSPMEDPARVKELFKPKEPPAQSELVKPKEPRLPRELTEPKETKVSKGSKEPTEVNGPKEPKKTTEQKAFQEIKDPNKTGKSKTPESMDSPLRRKVVRTQMSASLSLVKQRSNSEVKPQPFLTTVTAPALSTSTTRPPPKENNSTAEKAPAPRRGTASRVPIIADAPTTTANVRRRVSVGVAAQPDRRAATGAGTTRAAKVSLSPEQPKQSTSPPRQNWQYLSLRRKSLAALSYTAAKDQDAFRGLATDRPSAPRGKPNGVGVAAPAATSRSQKVRVHVGENSLDKQLVPFCTECGKKHIDDKAKFCAYCGHKREACT